MPDRSYEMLTPEDVDMIRKYTPGYDWIPGKFGPPPGISKAYKQKMDQMNDRDFMNAVMNLRQEEKESLMISEAQRRRTFGYLWPNPDCVNYKELAREGFYYTGRNDRVQCAFCAGSLGNWEPGDVPSISHKKFFSYCVMVKKRPCPNIPLSDQMDDLSECLEKSISLNQSEPHLSRNVMSESDLGIERSQPSHPRFKVELSRLCSFEKYSSDYPLKPEVLSEAGFFYEGKGDKVRCFWCDGALEMWADGDEPWIEHAKWYPGCSFLKLSKGLEFIRQSYSLLSAEEKTIAEELQYNTSGIQFLTKYDVDLDTTEEQKRFSDEKFTNFDSFQTCKSLGFDDESLKNAFALNEYNDFKNIQCLLDIVLNGKENLNHPLDCVPQGETDQIENKTEKTNEMISPQDDMVSLKVAEIIKDTFKFDEMAQALLVEAMNCHQCMKEQCGAILLPCGHLTLCKKCSFRNLPAKCSVCGCKVKGACRVFMA